MNNIKRLRLQANYKQDYVASVLGTHQCWYSRVESGANKLPQHWIKPLAELYSVSPSTITGTGLDVTEAIKEFCNMKGCDLSKILNQWEEYRQLVLA